MTISKYTKRKWFKRLLFSTLGIALALIVLAFIFENAIGRRVLSEVNNKLTSELKAQDLSLSLILSFPNVTLDLKNVSLQGADKKPMFKAARLRFKLGLFSLFSEKIIIQSVLIENGALLLSVNKSGKANYDILKPSEDKEAKSKVAFVLEKAVLKDLTIGYENVPDRQNLGFTINKATFKGDFADKIFDMNSTADIQTHGFMIGSNTFLINNKINYNTAIKVDLNKNLYQVKKFDLGIEKNLFEVNGTIIKNRKATQFDLDFAGKRCDLASLLQLLPQKHRVSFSDFQSEGTLSATATVKGTMTATQSPAINASFSLKNGTLKSPNVSDALEKINFTATFSNGEKHNASSSTFEIPNFSATTAGQSLSASLYLKNLDFPYLDFSFNGKLPLKSVYGFLQKNNSGTGFLTLQNISVKGFVEDMKKTSSINQVQMSGEIIAENIAIASTKGNIEVPKGDITFDNNNISIEKLEIQGLDNAVLIDGNVRNFLPVFINDSLHQNNRLDFDAKLYASKLDFNKLLQKETQAKSVKNQSNNSSRFSKPFYKYLEGNFQAYIENIDYQRIKAKNFVGKINFEENDININGSTDAMEGNIQLKARVATVASPDLHAIIICNKINATTFFYQCKNFGQKELTHENISGTLHTKIAIDAKWDALGNFLDDKLVTYAYLNVQNGEMKNVKTLDKFSTFVKIEDLHHIKFSNLENWFEIHNRWLFIPAMTIRSNALNMTLSGAQSFQKDINFNIKVNAAQVVVNRFKKFNPRLSPQKDIEDEGFFDLYFNMKGTLDNYEIEQAKTYVKAEFERSQARKKDIQSKLNAAVVGKDFQIPDKTLTNFDKHVAIPKEEKPQSYKIPKGYKPNKHKEDDIKNEFLEGF